MVVIDYFNTVVLGGLLHDIGKLKHRAGVRERHQVLSKRFVEVLQLPVEVHRELLPDIVEKHHDRTNLPEHLRLSQLSGWGKKLARIVAEADHLSSGEREPDASEDANRPLLPVFLDVRDERDVLSGEYYYLPQKFEARNIFPAQSYSVEELNDSYDACYNALVEEARQLSPSKFFIDNIYFLLEKYTSFALSAGYHTKPSVPLFDHLKTTAAIAACIYRYLEHIGFEYSVKSDAERFLLIQGDLSGLQRFIFSTHHSTASRVGASRRLRGRSLYLKLIMDSIAHTLLERLNLPRANLLWNTGGHFLILAPNTPSAREAVDATRSEVQRWLLVEYEGDLYLSLAYLPVSDEGLNLKNSRAKLQELINQEKHRRFKGHLKYLFTPEGEVVSPTEQCVACGKPGAQVGGERVLCEQCLQHEELGRALARAEYLVRSQKPVERLRGVKVLHAYYYLCSEEELDKATLEDAFILRLNHSDNKLYAKYPDSSHGFCFLANTVPLREGDVLSFSELAQLSRGAHRLGILKMDVDNLGEVFSGKLREESLSKYHTLSRMLETFFTGYLNELCEEFYVYPGESLCRECIDNAKEKIETRAESENGGPVREYFRLTSDEVCENCAPNRLILPYVVYAGGDDTLIAAPWDVAVKLALRIREDFSRLSCNNPILTLSCGFSTMGAREPVSLTVDVAEEYLNLAKSHFPEKDSIALFGECVHWKWNVKNAKWGFSELLELGEWLETHIAGGRLSKSFLYSLLQMWHVSFSKFKGDLCELERRRATEHAHIPHLYYKIARTVKNKEEREEILEKLKPMMPWIRIPVAYASLRLREERE